MTGYQELSLFTQLAIVVITLVYAIFAGGQWYTIWRQGKRGDYNLKITERAYINISPPPPGLAFEKDPIVLLEIKNFGETPAEITDIWTQWAEVLPKSPDYPRTGHAMFPRTFLVKTEWFFHEVDNPNILDASRIKSGDIKCFLYGYVDYRDAFGGRHRVGFARMYASGREKTNLIFIAQGRYSYDRERQRGEGNDWED